jgi:hypothetical protein
VMGGGGNKGKQVDTGERDETCGVNDETVQSAVGSTRGHTCSGWLSDLIKTGEVMCEICEVWLVCVYVCVCAMKLLNYREKGIVLALPGGMSQYGSSDQSRWIINCCSGNTLPVRLYVVICNVNTSPVRLNVVICTVNKHSFNEEPVEY